ncbi:MAG: 30S ribosome-binding factor RbfA [Microscillaceae bacterium]|nr:30S ribosome-binding factor RbfA [Microscillaceae bacterium]MDW8461026.1 30S ribosome-binding factor RbfA [Cytophagales bacterium]
MQESKRQQKFARLIREELSQIFLQNTRHLFSEKFITVTVVRVSSDLSVAKVYLSFLKATDKQAALDEIEEHKKEIRQLLAQRIGKQVRIIPELRFFLDDTAEYVERIENLLSKIHIPPAENPTESEAK